jgi:ligand-binding SRPBCC domain-containing protein
VPLLRCETRIAAPIDLCFDLARDIDLHMRSTPGTDEVAVGGVTSGLIGLGESVTWEARHFGVRQRLTSKITAFDRPNHFRDSMVEGAFARFDHDHYFQSDGFGTVMVDLFDYTSPLGLLGKLADRLFLARYMRELLRTRAEILRAEAERQTAQYHSGGAQG